MHNTATRLTIAHAASGTSLVDARPGQFAEIEGNWYVDPAAVDARYLELTEHEYVCPYKGHCFYVDYVSGATRVPRVGWVYDDVKADWEHIRGKYGFYAGETAAKFGKTKDTVG